MQTSAQKRNIKYLLEMAKKIVIKRKTHRPLPSFAKTRKRKPRNEKKILFRLDS